MPRHFPALYQNIDEAYMARCLYLAELGAGTVSPNPLVGAVVLDAQGRVVGEGYHQRAGEAHAEVIALDAAGEQAKGGTLYVNLEPCNHQGRTPPCTKRIIEAGIQRVVCGTLDPNPLVSGTGRDLLQNSRIEVRYGFLETECKRLNEIFFHYITTRMPFVTVKLGLTMDGKIANRHGESRWLTGTFSREYVHHLRQNYDAILTTAETVLIDNPKLNVRDIPNIRKQPAKIIVDRRFRLNVDRYQIFKGEAPVWILTSKANHNPGNAKKARSQGFKIIEVDETGHGLDLKAAFAQLAEHEITSIFVESGGRLASSLMSDGLANKFYLFYAPKTLRDAMAKPAFGHAFQLELPESPQLEIIHTRQIDQDWVIEAKPYKNGRKYTGKGIPSLAETESAKLVPPRQAQQELQQKEQAKAATEEADTDVPAESNGKHKAKAAPEVQAEVVPSGS
jgi:diaminohydroxyphosphoribosylaminopyrimidine deaminase/5-amino-6-(5-phosphoribosylamino)uracil reductase